MSWLAALSLALALALPAAAVLEPQYDFDTYKIFDIKGILMLYCKATNNEKLTWYKEDKLITEVTSLKNRYDDKTDEHKIIIAHAQDVDAGNYTCKDLASGQSANITAIAKPYVRLPEHTSVVEGEKLKLTCQAFGNPKPVVEWTIGNITYATSDGRVTLIEDNGVVNSIFILDNVTLDDRGEYSCMAKNLANNYVNATKDVTFVRVKDNLAALWPFLGICAEVFVLCAIILIYEKRRNKPEMDESDTDQSPDQKNTPDHGKDRDVRHRK